jgi:hypothetical protein
MVLQVAAQDIGQLTDIHHPPGTGKPPTLNGVASIGTGLANLHRKTGHRDTDARGRPIHDHAQHAGSGRREAVVTRPA